MLLKDTGRCISLACLHGRFPADSFSDLVRGLSVFRQNICITYLLHALRLYTSRCKVSKSCFSVEQVKISEDKDGMLEKGHISHRPCGCNSNCSGLSAPLSLMSKANYLVEISYSLNIVCMTVAACEAFTL